MLSPLSNFTIEENTDTGIQRNDEDRVLMEYRDNNTVSCSMEIFQKECNEVTHQPLLVNDRDIKSDIFNGLREKP